MSFGDIVITIPSSTTVVSSSLLLETMLSSVRFSSRLTSSMSPLAISLTATVSTATSQADPSTVSQLQQPTTTLSINTCKYML